MAFTTHCVRPFLFVHWERPELADIAPLDQAMQRFHREIGEPLVSVSLLDQRTSPPEAEVRSALVEQTRASQIIRAFYTVVGGSGFVATVHRSVLAGMFLVHRGPIRPIVARSVDEILDREAGNYTAPRAEILRELRTRELLVD